MSNEEQLIQDNFRRDAADAAVDFYVSHNGEVTANDTFEYLRKPVGETWSMFDDVILRRVAKRTITRLNRVAGKKLQAK